MLIFKSSHYWIVLLILAIQSLNFMVIQSIESNYWYLQLAIFLVVCSYTVVINYETKIV